MLKKLHLSELPSTATAAAPSRTALAAPMVAATSTTAATVARENKAQQNPLKVATAGAETAGTCLGCNEVDFAVQRRFGGPHLVFQVKALHAAVALKQRKLAKACIL